jgi:hypothetical protein
MYDDPIYARVINLILIVFLLICFRTNARHGVWGALRLSHNALQLPLVTDERVSLVRRVETAKRQSFVFWFVEPVRPVDHRYDGQRAEARAVVVSSASYAVAQQKEISQDRRNDTATNSSINSY